MFTPDREDVRRFFIETWQKRQQQHILSPIEMIAADWIGQHPEYHTQLSHSKDNLQAEYTPESEQTNPFLHLSMHLAISEQVSANQPIGIRPIFEKLSAKLDSAHQAHHLIMDCLAQAIWQAQKNQQPINAEDYLEKLNRLI